jgi:6-pyruvoyltetrahydropterin/6-carboxytetrahydropterin synthase
MAKPPSRLRRDRPSLSNPSLPPGTGADWTLYRPCPYARIMPVADLTRAVRFSAAHRYYRPEWSEAENARVFGPCSNPHGHGHNYVLHATVRGEIDPLTGFSADLAALDAVLRAEVLEPLDHQHLNHVVPEFAPGARVPTSENILVLLWPRIERGLPDRVRLVRLRLEEEPGLVVDYFGDPAAADS